MTVKSAQLDRPSSVKVSTQISYGIGQIAGQIYRDIPSLLLLFFMTNILGISPAIAGSAIFLPKFLVGAVGDIAVGILIDRWRKRVPLYYWLLFGAVVAPIAMILLFTIPNFAANIQIPYIVTVMSLYMLAFASFSVPYLAIASAMSKNPHQRTVLMAWRLVFTAIGMLLAGGIAPAFVSAVGGDAAAYSLMAIALAALCTLSLLISFFGARSAIKKLEPMGVIDDVVASASVKDMIRAIKVPRFSTLLGCNILQLTGTGMSYATMLYYLTYVMNLPNAFEVVGIILFMIIAGIIASQPIWVATSKRIGKKNVYIIACVIHAISLIAWGLLAPTFGLNAALIAAIFLGVGNSGWVMAGFSMVTDVAGEGRAGLFSAVWIAADKIAFALGGTILVGFLLSAFGFNSASAVNGLAQAPSAINGIAWSFAFIPAILYFMGAAIFYKWGVETESR